MSIARSAARVVARNGRPMTLRRRVGTGLTSFTTATVTGFMAAYSPGEIIGLIQQGDARVTIGSDVGTLTAPRQDDTLLIDGAMWRVLGVYALNHGNTPAGWRLWVRGGST